MRALLEQLHREAASTAGELSLLLTRDRITKRDLLGLSYKTKRIAELSAQIDAILGREA